MVLKLSIYYSYYFLLTDRKENQNNTISRFANRWCHYMCMQASRLKLLSVYIL